MDAAKIELWIDVIENSDALYDKDKQIENLINLWKFSSCYNSNAKITDEGLLNTLEQENISVSFTDIYLDSSEKSNYINTLLNSIPHTLDDNPASAYYVELYHQKNNFNSDTFQQLEEEIVNAIQGKLIPFNHVKKIIKVSAKAGIYTNITVKQCNREDINKAIAGTPTYKNSPVKWQVLVLDRLINNCDSFYINNDVLQQSFKTDYDKLFLFDFYKGEIIELITL